jgi:hypothetical protein
MGVPRFYGGVREWIICIADKLVMHEPLPWRAQGGAWGVVAYFMGVGAEGAEYSVLRRS